MTARPLALLLLLVAASLPLHAEETFSRGIVSSVHPLATDAGVNVLKQGGNAIDAAVAVALTLGVVDGANSGLGGGCLMLIRRANGELVALDGRETAPAAATRDMFLPRGKADTRLSQTGALASGVPGALAAYEFAVQHYGRKKLADLLLPAADLAERGFLVDARYAGRVKEAAKDLARFESSRAVFFKPNGRPLPKGERFKQPDLAATYRAIAGSGSDWFYRGPFAQATERWMNAHGGLLTAQDFHDYRIQLREPIVTRYRTWQIVGFPPPSSGGVHVAQILNIVEHFDLKSLDAATRLHVLAEAMKFAFADRAHWLGDPDFARVPRGLVSRDYAATLARQIRLDRAIAVPTHGAPPDWRTDVFPKHTTHFSVADAEGNWVACTATINTTFGSKVVVPGTGVVLNNELDDFAIQPGVPNFFGAIGGDANAVAPGKRPLSSMSPTLVLKDGQPILALGAAGGPKIISAVAQELVGLLDLGLTPNEALTHPRLHHQWRPDQLVVEKALPRDLRAALAKRGHKIKKVSATAVSQIVARTADARGFIGAADPRAGGSAAGW